MATAEKPSRYFQFALRDLLLIVMACAIWVAILPRLWTLQSFDDRFDSTLRYPWWACGTALLVVLLSGVLALILTASARVGAATRSWWLAICLVIAPTLTCAVTVVGGHADTGAYFAHLRIDGLASCQERYRMEHHEYSPNFTNLVPFMPGSEAVADGRPFNGYVFRVLMAQGPHAPGGSKNYVTTDKDGKERMTEGFAIIAIPVSGERGIAFLLSQNGSEHRLFGKALGSDAANIASQILEFDPDESWIEVRR